MTTCELGFRAPPFARALTSRSERVFAALGFPLDKLKQGDGKEEDALQPPPIDPATAEGKASRTKLLRAWVELSAWLAIYEKANSELRRARCVRVLALTPDPNRGRVQELQHDGHPRQGGQRARPVPDGDRRARLPESVSSSFFLLAARLTPQYSIARKSSRTRHV